MQKKEEKIILYDSPEAASYGIFEVEGWKDSEGRIWDEEHMARYSGCTHKKCEKCGNTIRKNSFCNECADKKRRERYSTLEAVPINFHDEDMEMIYDDNTDRYYNDIEELIDSYWDSDSKSLKDIDKALVYPCYYCKLDIIDVEDIIAGIYSNLDSDVNPNVIMPLELEDILMKIEEYNELVSEGDGINNGMYEVDLNHKIDITKSVEEYLQRGN